MESVVGIVGQLNIENSNPISQEGRSGEESFIKNYPRGSTDFKVLRTRDVWFSSYCQGVTKSAVEMMPHFKFQDYSCYTSARVDVTVTNEFIHATTIIGIVDIS